LVFRGEVGGYVEFVVFKLSDPAIARHQAPINTQPLNHFKLYPLLTVAHLESIEVEIHGRLHITSTPTNTAKMYVPSQLNHGA
jgi:hypothetical protein